MLKDSYWKNDEWTKATADITQVIFNRKDWWPGLFISPFLQDASSSAGASKDSKGDAFDLQKLIELERRVRKAEAKKQQKSQAKAEKKAQKMERRRAKKEAKKTKRKDKSEEGTQPKRWWHR